MTQALDRSDIERRLLAFIRAELVAPGEPVAPDDDLLSELLDSMAVLRLATFVDEEFGLVTKPRDFVIENFATVEALAGYVLRAAGGSSS